MRYGPHRPEDAQTGWITVVHGSRATSREQVPLSDEVARQRAQINEHAARQETR